MPRPEEGEVNPDGAEAVSPVEGLGAIDEEVEIDPNEALYDPNIAKFDLDEALLAEYPEMASISGATVAESPRDTSVVSAAYVNSGTIDRYIEDVEAGRATGDIEYHLQLVEECLAELAAMNNPNYERFIAEETKKLGDRRAKAQVAIGDKKRDTSVEGGGRYL